MVPGHCSLEPRPLNPVQVWHSSDDRSTHSGTGHLDLAVRRAGWAWRGAWALSVGNRSMYLGLVPSAEALILGLRTWASSQGLPPVGLLPSRTTWSYVLTFSCHFIIHLHCRYLDAIQANHPIHCPVRFFLTSLAPW